MEAPTARSRQVATTVVVIVGAALLTTLVVPGVGAAAAASDAQSTASTADGLEDVIHPDLRDAAGTQEVVVRLESADEAAIAQSTGEDRVRALKHDAERSQRDVVQTASASEDAKVHGQFWLANAVLLEVDLDGDALERLASIESVDRIHPNYEASATAGTATQTGETKQPVGATAQNVTYGLETVGAPTVWEDRGVRGEGATVAVLDTGVDPDHPDIDLATENDSDPTYPGGWADFDSQGNLLPGSEPHDVDGHGTHVAGTATGGNASGTAIGVAPGADLLAGKALGDDGEGTFVRIIASMEWAVEQDADVLTMSLGVDGHPADFVEPVRNANEAGSLVVGAAGRYGADSSAAPGNVYEASSVGAIDAENEVIPSSGGQVVNVSEDWGAAAPEDWPDTYVQPDVAAPGHEVHSAAPGGDYRVDTGTSMATPHVAGTAALMVSAGDDPSPSVLQAGLERTAWKPEDAPEEQDPRYGHGVIDAEAATDHVLEAGVEGVVTSDGVPVADAEVSAGDVTVRTDEDGSYRLPLQPGNYTLGVDGFGVEPTSMDVTVPDGEFVTVDASTSRQAAVAIASQPSAVVAAGEEGTATFSVASAEAVAVDLLGSYDASNATVTLNGEQVAVGETVEIGDETSEVTVDVATAANATGEFAIRLSVAGAGDSAVETRSVAVVEDVVDVAVVGSNQRRLAAMADDLEGALPVEYRVEPLHVEDAAAEIETYDAAVLQYIGDEERAETLGELAVEHDVGVVLLEQWGEESDAITQVAAATDLVGGVEQRDLGTPPVEYTVERDHPILGGIGEPGDAVPVHTGEYADHAWFVEPRNVTVLASVGDQDAVSGAGLAVAEDYDLVLAAGLGRSQFVPNDAFTDEGNQLLANAVEHAVEGETVPSRPTLSVGDASIAPGQTTTVAVETTADDVAGYQAALEFDADVLSVVDVDGAALDDPEVNVDEDAGRVTFAQAGANGTDATVLAHVEFEAVAEAEGQTALEFDPEDTQLHDANGRAIDVDLAAGTVDVLACVPGDANQDGDVTAADATLVLRDVVGLPVDESYDEACADVDGDGQITPVDATRILRIAVGIEDPLASAA